MTDAGGTSAVIGLGTMGAGIAATMARGGWKVRAFDIEPEAVARSRARLPALAGVLDALDMPNRGDATDIAFRDTLAEAVEGADLVLENVPEKLELKRRVLAEIEALVRPDCVIASDTSGLPITRLQAGLSAPGRVVGMHWSNPPHIVPVVEVVAGERTSAETAAWMAETVRGLGLIPVPVKRDVPGFVENRILYAILREALDLVDDGVIEAEDLDTCVSWGIGYKLAVVGPLALLDMAGLDIYRSVAGYLNRELSGRRDVSPLVAALTAEGSLGLKSGAGIYGYRAEQAATLPAQRAATFVALRRVLQGKDRAPA